MLPFLVNKQPSANRISSASLLAGLLSLVLGSQRNIQLWYQQKT